MKLGPDVTYIRALKKSLEASRPPAGWAVWATLPIFAVKKYFFLQMSNNYISLERIFDADQNCLRNLGLKMYGYRVSGGQWG